MSWESKAACKGLDTSYFFPSQGRVGSAETQQAIALCSTCIVKTECLEDALHNGPKDCGIRGGLTTKEIARLRKQRGISLNKGFHYNLDGGRKVAEG